MLNYNAPSINKSKQKNIEYGSIACYVYIISTIFDKNKDVHKFQVNKD